MPNIQSSSPMMPMAPMQRSMSQPMIQNRGPAPISQPQMNAETRALMARGGGVHKPTVSTLPPFCMGPNSLDQAVMQAQAGGMQKKGSFATQLFKSVIGKSLISVMEALG